MLETPTLVAALLHADVNKARGFVMLRLRKKESVRALVEKGWLRLHALLRDSRICSFRAPGDWRDVANAIPPHQAA